MHLSRRRMARSLTSVAGLLLILAAIVLCSYIIADEQIKHLKRELNIICAPATQKAEPEHTSSEASPAADITEPIKNEVEKQDITIRKPCTILVGNDRNYKGFLMIGIPTMSREGASYLFKTLDSFIVSTSDEEKKSLVLVVFLADPDYYFRSSTSGAIASQYPEHIESGFILVIEPVTDSYPTFENLPQTFNDPEHRVKWRSKQVVDFAYLVRFCQHRSDFYMTMEDDVEVKPDFLEAVGSFVNEQVDPWVMLEFSTLGSIGKLFQSEDLERLSDFLLLFYSAQPLDFLLIYFRLLNTQMKPKLRSPTLFQHVGLQSSLENKTQPIKDKLVDSPSFNKLTGDNPPATILTTMPIFEDHHEQNPYEIQSENYFWTSRPAEKGDFYTVMFSQPVSLERVVVATGSEGHPDDILHSGNLEVSVETQPPWNVIEPCSKFVVVGTFVRGRIDVSDLSSAFPNPVKCIRLFVTGTQETWLVINEVSVFLSRKNSTSV